jgi:hypothetical protein
MPQGNKCTPKGFQLRKNLLMEQFHIVVVSLTDQNSETIDSVFKCFGKDWERIPINTSPSAIQVPTGEIFVKFKDEMTTQQVREQLQGLNLPVVELPVRANSAYKVAQTPLSGAHSHEAVESLRRLSCVQYAQPNWLII